MKEKKYMCEAGIITQYGFTKTMIKKYLGEPEKYATNPYYHTAPKEKLWSIETIEKIINLQEIKDYLDKLSLRREKSKLKKEQIEKEKQEKMKKIKELFNIYSLDYLIALSKGYPKNYHLHVGPTNSGKTYHAIEKITSSTKGQYLGPLRLLAMEIADKLNYKNIPCSILTGEEHIAVENSLFTASTIELCDYNKEMDIVVIDEAQLIGDAYRGHNYLKAILLAKAKDIHICLSESGYEIITHILDTAQFTYEVNRYKRLVPLKYGGTINKLSDIEPGDAIIVFSRKKVIQLSTILESQGIKTSIIYGKLPPQNRRTQVEAYINHQSDVIVSTDAIGMGISIPIKRIIFWETEKYDGKESRSLTNDELLQIAGRAGRFGMYDQGEYLYYSKVTNITIIKNTSDSISTIYIPFPIELLSYNEYTLDMMLEAWSNLESKDKIGYQNLDTAAFLYNYASHYKNHKNQLLCYKLITCPFDKNNYDLLNYWYECYVRILNGKEPYLHDYYLETLYDYESEYKRVELYNYMMKCINIEPNTEEYMQKLSEKINQKIKEKNRFIYY